MPSADGSGLSAVDAEAMAHRLGLIVLPPHERAAAPGTGRARLAPGEGRLALLTDGAARQPANELVVRYLEEENGPHLAAELAQDALEPLRLRHGANDTVEDDTARHLRPLERVLHDAEDNVVGHKRAAIHVRLGGFPHRRAFPHRGAQHIPRCNLRNPEALRNRLGLGSLAGAGRPEENEDHETTIADC